MTKARCIMVRAGLRETSRRWHSTPVRHGERGEARPPNSTSTWNLRPGAGLEIGSLQTSSAETRSYQLGVGCRGLVSSEEEKRVRRQVAGE